MSQTNKYGFHYPLSSDSTNLAGPSGVTGTSAGDIGWALAQIDSIIATETSGTFAQRPSYGVFGRRYFVIDPTDTVHKGLEYFDTGGAWLNVGPINTAPGNVTSSVPGATSLSGNSGLSADAANTHAREGIATTSDIQPIADVASTGSTTRWVDAGHVHAGGSSLGDIKATANTQMFPLPSGLASVTPVNGWLPAANQILSSAPGSQFLPFYNACGGDAAYPWGKNTSTRTFNLPNLVDKTLIGSGSTYSMGQVTGSAYVTLSPANLPSHEHPLQNLDHNHGFPNSTILNTGPAGGPGFPTSPVNFNFSAIKGMITSNSLGTSDGAYSTKGTSFSNTQFSVLQPSAGILYLIKVV